MKRFPFNDWSIAEIDKLKQLTRDKFSIATVCEVLRRPPADVWLKIAHLEEQREWRTQPSHVGVSQ